MNTNFTIKNFRVFDENGVSLELKPITILTGCNSSGKSSIVKSLLLLCDYFSSIKKDKDNGEKIILSSYELDFTKKPHNLLGKFSKVVNYNSKEKNITFKIKVHSLMLIQDVNIELVFSIDENYFNGDLSSISIMKLDGTIIYSSSKESLSIGNLYCLIPDFIKFVPTQHFISSLQMIDINKRIGINENTMSDKEFENYKDEVKKYINDYIEDFGNQSLKEIIKWNNEKRIKSGGVNNRSFLGKCSPNNTEIIKGVYDTGILYYLPIFDEKLNGDKSKCIEFLTDCIDQDSFDKATLCILKQILEDFKNSSYDNFYSYYKSWEEKRLSEFVINPSYETEKTPRLFYAKHLGIEANEILMAPHNTSSSAPIDIFTGEAELQKPKEEQEAEWEAEPLNFNRLYEALAILSVHFVPQNTIYFNRPNGREYWGYDSRTEYLFFKYIETAIKEIVIDATPEALSYVSSSVINVKRLYPIESEDEFTTLLKRYLKAKRNINKNAKYLPDTFLNKWIRQYGIGYRISIDVDPEGLGITLKLHKDENDINGSLLADSGYGITQLFAILLNIEIAIMERKIIKSLPDNYLGSLPAIKDYIMSMSSSTIAIEEPEIHLHPNYQSMLAEMFVDAYANYNIHFIIETHSEYLIRRLQLLVAGKDIFLRLRNDEVSVMYIYSLEESQKTGDPQVKEIRICNDGYLDDTFGTGFFDEATSLSRQLL